MRFGILGTGRITRRLVADMQSTPGVTVTAIASRQGERARWYAEQYGIAVGTSGYADLLAREDVDAVYIALPPAFHREWAIAAARVGKAVLCEKPLATSLADCYRIADACNKQQQRWLDATGWLHHPRTAAISKAIGKGTLGELRHVSAAVSFFEPFQTQDHRLDASLGGGCLLDLGWYAVGVAVWALGEPLEVQATAIDRDGVLFRVSAMLSFEHQRTATINCGYDTTTRKWCEIAGDQGSIVCDDFTRPWPEKPARFWIHDRAGSAEQQQFSGNQETVMIERFAGQESLTAFHRQAMLTQATLEAIMRSLSSGNPEPIATDLSADGGGGSP